jgi:muramoyltetrapeptide carboxypeptidase
MNLMTGDVVSIIAPAAQLRGADRGLLAAAEQLLASWGLTVEVRVDPTHHFYLAGPDESRAAHLEAALDNSATRAIFCLRGGYGTARILTRLSTSLSPINKLIVGYSDATALHLLAGSRWPNVELVHGPNIATRQFLGDESHHVANRRSLYATLFDDCHDLREQVEFLRPGNASGPLIGGCLSVIAASMGTAYAPKTDGTILFLEDAGEAPYRMVRCADPYNDIRAVITDVFRSAPFPVAFGLPSGHSDLNLSLKFGSLATLDDVAQSFSLTRNSSRFSANTDELVRWVGCGL